MLVHRATIMGFATATALTLAAGGASAASLNPRATVSLAQLSCPGGQVLDVYGIANGGQPVHATNGFVVGGAIAARWSTGEDTGTITIADGVHAGESIPYDEVFAGPVGTSAGRKPAPDLSRLVACTSISDPTFEWTGTLSQEDIDFLGLAADYVGAAYSVTGSRTFTVYLVPEQLAHR
jgi:hypothetical protein